MSIWYHCDGPNVGYLFFKMTFKARIGRNLEKGKKTKAEFENTSTLCSSHLSVLSLYHQTTTVICTHFIQQPSVSHLIPYFIVQLHAAHSLNPSLPWSLVPVCLTPLCCVPRPSRIKGPVLLYQSEEITQHWQVDFWSSSMSSNIDYILSMSFTSLLVPAFRATC